MQITEFSGKLNTEQKVTFMLNTLDNIQILIKNMIDSHPRLISFKNYYRKPISKKKRNLNNNFYQNLSEKIQLLIQELTSLYDAIIKSANDISNIFKPIMSAIPIKNKNEFSLIKIHKEIFYTVLLDEDDIMKKMKEFLENKSKNNNSILWVNEILTQIKSETKGIGKEMERFKKFLINYINENNNYMKVTDDNNRKEYFDIDELVSYINNKESVNNKKERKKGCGNNNNRKNSKTNDTNSISTDDYQEEIDKIEMNINSNDEGIMSQLNNIYNNNHSTEIEEEIIRLKNFLRTGTIKASKVNKIKPIYTHNWLEQLN